MNFEIDAGDLCTAVALIAASALTEFSKSNVSIWAKFDTRRNEHAVNVDASLALEFEEHVYSAGIVCSAAQNPAPAAEDGAC